MTKLELNLKRRAVLTGLGAGLAAMTLPTSLLAASPRKVVLLMAGGIADGGWNTLAFRGLEELAAMDGIETAYVENVTQARAPEIARGYADDGFDLVIGHGYEFGALMAEIAPEYPDQSFFATTYAPGADIPANVLYADLAYVAVAYAAGALAALISEEGRAVGFVGGGDNPTQQSMGRAFAGGAEETVSGIKGLGIVTGDYHDAAKGKEAALTMIGNGADVIWHAADVTGLGAIQGVAESEGVKALGCYANQTSIAPQEIATSFAMNLGWMVVQLGTAIANGSFVGGEEWKPTVAEMWSAVYGEGDDAVPVNPDLVSEESYAVFTEVMEKLSSGEIDVTRFLQG